MRIVKRDILYNSQETLNVLLVFIKHSPAAFVLPDQFYGKSFLTNPNQILSILFHSRSDTLCSFYHKINTLIDLKTSENVDNRISSDSNGITIVMRVGRSSLVV